MIRSARTNIKILTLFVLAFLCLNAVGLVCISYCIRDAQMSAAHCPQAPKTEHCPTKNRAAAQIAEYRGPEVRSAGCCSLPVSMVAVPLEKQVNPTFLSVAAVPADRPKFTFSPFREVEQAGGLVYRPPPLDSRGNRLRNCVIRI